MARAKDLAALAGLAGLAYAYNKGKDKEGPSATAEENAASKARMDAQKNAVSGNRVTDTGDETNRLLARSPAPDYSNEGRNKPPKVSDSAVKPKPAVVKPKPAAATSDPRNLEAGMSRGTRTILKDPREAEAGMSRGTRTPAKPVAATSDPRNLEAGMSRGTRTPAKPVSTTSSSEEGMKNYKPRNTPANPVKDTAVSAAKAAVNTAVQGPASAVKPLVDKVVAKSGSDRVPTSDQAAANRQAAYDKVKSVGSSVVDYVKNFETPAERRSREAKEASGMKRGGMTKMASGGMTASRRGDGIATKGKTRGKIC